MAAIYGSPLYAEQANAKTLRGQFRTRCGVQLGHKVAEGPDRWAPPVSVSVTRGLLISVGSEEGSAHATRRSSLSLRPRNTGEEGERELGYGPEPQAGKWEAFGPNSRGGRKRK